MVESTMSRDEYNQMVLEQIDDTGTEHDETCPSCGLSARKRNFEACHTGSVNQHYTLDCAHCGFHKCDQDDGCCASCDTHKAIDYCYDAFAENRDADGKYNILDQLLSALTASLIQKGTISPLDWTSIKLVAIRKPETVLAYTEWGLQRYREQVMSSYKAFIQYQQRQILDQRFNYRLRLKIERAKQELTDHTVM